MMYLAKKFIAWAPMLAATLLTAACGATDGAGAPDSGAEAEKAVAPAASAGADITALEAIVAARSDDDKVRDEWRNPVETLAFFGVEPDDTVIEVLPGRGWYTRVVLPYVAEKGRYAGITYQYDMFPLVLPNPSDEVLADLKVWTETFPVLAGEWAVTDEPIDAFEFGVVAQDALGQADVVLMVRALHNFNRAGGGFRDEAIADVFALLKPGGVLGVVQHRAADDAAGPQGDGSLGYLKTADVIAMMEEAGLIFEQASEINANPADQPGAGEFVWRLPPGYAFGDTDRDAYAAIGESNRMTLRFRKPVE